MLSALLEDQADDIIDATLADDARLGLSFRWTVGPESAPPDLAVRLARRGLVAEPVRAMAVELPSIAAAQPSPSLQVERVTLASEPALTRVMAEGWSTDPAVLEAYHRRVLHMPNAHTRLFVASLSGEPAGSASYVVVDDVAFLMGAAVRPRFRGRGVYRALVRARLLDALAARCTLAATHAGALSAPILARLGFASLCEFLLFSPP